MLYNSANFNTDYYVFFFACIDTHIKIPDNGMEDGVSAAPNNKAGGNYCCAGPE